MQRDFELYNKDIKILGKLDFFKCWCLTPHATTISNPGHPLISS